MYIHVCTLSIRNPNIGIDHPKEYNYSNMIKPINITPLNTTTHASFECNNCGAKDVITFTNKTINVDKQADIEDLQDMECPNCGTRLGT